MIQSAIATAGLARQTAQGNPADDAAFHYGVLSGSVARVEIDQSAEDRTSGRRMIPGVNRNAVMGGMEHTTRAFPSLTGVLLLAALGAVDSTGAGPTWEHVFTPAKALPYLTGFGRLDDEYVRIQDGKVDELSISWEGNGPLELGVTIAGTRVTFPTDFGTIVNDEVLEPNYFKASAGAFLVDVDGDTPVAAIVTGGEITISNNLESILAAGSILPRDVFEGRQDIAVSLTVVPASVADWRSILTGAPAGSIASSCPIYGSFDLTFTGCVDENHALQFAAPRVSFAVDFPDANPQGGKVELELEGMISQPVDGTTDPFEATLTNALASYAAA